VDEVDTSAKNARKRNVELLTYEFNEQRASNLLFYSVPQLMSINIVVVNGRQLGMASGFGVNSDFFNQLTRH
jgi:hypothetical protein